MRVFACYNTRTPKGVSYDFRASQSSGYARAREPFPDIHRVVVILGSGLHEFVVRRGGNVKEVVHAAVGKLHLESPKIVRFKMETNLGYAYRGNGDPMHLLRAPLSSRATFSPEPTRHSLG